MKRKTVLTVLFIVLILGSGWIAWQKLSDRNKAGHDVPVTSESEYIPAVTESASETAMTKEAGSAQEDTQEERTADEDMPEGGTEIGTKDPDAPEGDADADELPEGDAEIPMEDPDAAAGDPELPAGDSNVNTAPDFKVLDMDGQEVQLSDLFGQRILINFWATWCPPCRAELPYFEEAYQEYGDDIVFLMVDLTDGSQETVEGVKDFCAENGYSFPVYYDTEFSAVYAYSIDAIPQTYAIGSDGNVLMNQVGSMSKARLKEFTDALLRDTD